MTVAAAYWISNSLQAVEDLLVACPTFATLGFNASNTYWQDVRSAAIDAPYCCIVMLPSSEGEDEANKIVVRRNNVAAYMVWPISNTVGDTEKEKTKRATNPFGQLLDEIAGKVGTAGFIPRCHREYDPPSRTNDKDDQDEAGDCWEAAISFSWEI